MRISVCLLLMTVMYLSSGCRQAPELNYAEERPTAQQLAGEYRLTSESAALAERVLTVRPPEDSRLRIAPNGTFEGVNLPGVLGWSNSEEGPVENLRGSWYLKREPEGWTLHLVTSRKVDFTDKTITADKEMFVERQRPPYRLHHRWLSEEMLVFDQQ